MTRRCLGDPLRARQRTGWKAPQRQRSADGASDARGASWLWSSLALADVTGADGPEGEAVRLLLLLRALLLLLLRALLWGRPLATFRAVHALSSPYET
jgi:hypothetical protein